MAILCVMTTLAGFAWIFACGDGAVVSAPPEPVRPVSITVEPSEATLTWLGETVAFRATVKDQYGAVFPGTTWSGSDETVFTIDVGGTATAVANGSGTVTATFQSLSATAAVQVEQVPASLATVSGEDQTADLGAVLAEPVVARVLDSYGGVIAVLKRAIRCQMLADAENRSVGEVIDGYCSWRATRLPEADFDR